MKRYMIETWIKLKRKSLWQKLPNSPKYERSRIHKTEGYYEQQIINDVHEHICDWFGVDNVEELSGEQIDEVITFRKNILNEYSVMQIGYSDVIMA